MASLDLGIVSFSAAFIRSSVLSSLSWMGISGEMTNHWADWERDRAPGEIMFRPERVVSVFRF